MHVRKEKKLGVGWMDEIGREDCPDCGKAIAAFIAAKQAGVDMRRTGTYCMTCTRLYSIGSGKNE